MLNDTSRKLLLILTHYQRHFGRLPGMPELERLSGRLPVPIKEGLAILAKENYIQWEPSMPPERAVIIEGWERPDPRFKRVETATQDIQWGTDGGTIEYWTKY